MADQLVVINGAPGAGKTTLARPLADALGGVLVAKDTIKEALAESVNAALPTSRLGALALDALWRIAGMVPGLVVVEGFWFPERDAKFFRAGYASLDSPPAVEVWVHAPLDVMRARYLTRDRHHAHDDAARIAEWEGFAVAAGPVNGFPVVEVDGSVPVDPVVLAQRVVSAFA